MRVRILVGDPFHGVGHALTARPLGSAGHSRPYVESLAVGGVAQARIETDERLTVRLLFAGADLPYQGNEPWSRSPG